MTGLNAIEIGFIEEDNGTELSSAVTEPKDFWLLSGASNVAQPPKKFLCRSREKVDRLFRISFTF